MVRTYARNIEIRMSGDSGEAAYWYDDQGNIKTQKASLRSDNKVGFSIPDKTEGILIIDEDMGKGEGCEACMIITTSVSFEPVPSTDPLCGEAATDAELSWHRLVNEAYSPELYNRLDEFRKPGNRLKIQFQHLRAGQETYYDEFAIIVKLPDGRQDFASETFAAMRRKLDTVGLGEAAKEFMGIGTFRYFEPKRIEARSDKLPVVGDIFQVDIRPGLHLTGIDDGDVMMTELLEGPRNSRFRYSTLNNDLAGGSGSHPNNGSREYGYFTTLDGWTKFYVRGVDQFKYPIYANSGRPHQDKFWLSFLEGIGNRVKFYNGEIIYPVKKTVNGTLTTTPKCHVPPQKGYRYEG